MLASNDPKSHSLDLRDVCAQDAKMTAMAIPGAQHNERTEMKTLVERLWDSDELNNLRLRYVLCLWAKVSEHYTALASTLLTVETISQTSIGVRTASGRSRDTHRQVDPFSSDTLGVIRSIGSVVIVRASVLEDSSVIPIASRWDDE